MDSCYLCVVGGTQLPAQANRKASEGFGTCNACGVHACQIHGESWADAFSCADCLAAMNLIAAVTAVPRRHHRRAGMRPWSIRPSIKRCQTPDGRIRPSQPVSLCARPRYMQI